MLHVAHTVWAQDDATFFCAASLQLGNFIFRLIQTIERSVNSQLSGEEYLLVECSMLSVDYRYSSLRRNLRNLRFKNTNRALTCSLFGFQVAAVNSQMFTLMSQLPNVR